MKKLDLNLVMPLNVRMCPWYQLLVWDLLVHHIACCLAYHAVLNGQQVRARGVSLKQRLIKSKALCRLVDDYGLQLLVVANQDHLLWTAWYDRHQTLCLFTHGTLIYDNLHTYKHTYKHTQQTMTQRGGSAVGRWTCDLQVAGSIPGQWLSHNIGQLSLASLWGR